MEDHEKIEKTMDKLKQEKNLKKIKKIFEEFKWDFEKHLFTEERTVFTFFNPQTEEEYQFIPEMLKDHDKLLNFLKQIEKEIIKGKINLNAFEELMKKHKQFEEEFFYPKLDKELSKQQKNTIINRLK